MCGKLQNRSIGLSKVPFLDHTCICAAGKLHSICGRPLDIPNRIRIALEGLQHSKGWAVASLYWSTDIKTLDGPILTRGKQPIVLERTYGKSMNLPRMFLNAPNLEPFSYSIEIVDCNPSIPGSRYYCAVQAAIGPCNCSDIELIRSGG